MVWFYLGFADHAGIDNVSIYGKMHAFTTDPDRKSSC